MRFQIFSIIKVTYAQTQDGDEVVFGRYAGTKVQIEDAEHVIMTESDVLGVKGASIADMKPLEVQDHVSFSCKLVSPHDACRTNA